MILDFVCCVFPSKFFSKNKMDISLPSTGRFNLKKKSFKELVYHFLCSDSYYCNRIVHVMCGLLFLKIKYCME